ncbi:MAG: UDP-N-acetylmuramoyl-L-alanyl-D-glutamate--2,6-diaminopimelate ligase [Candidatus Omnitrophica bacterium]|jgi:UDP-N-acetylmuramoyl-L-alanyl-D-glutamate--2,6-diaminopimelate ligase|nr:UDP-N-acetylmuramoyl-L-alanyl-D-glutamate--2,6-diaminopimelate ligase [Candidatus Omnitrophota bacterium]MDD4982129.1 UDP-N-acetylmuramoyl-L-alanyl-D-glutamate--2,6-diaminopimelate ligase [Candidatus Omnitrophota bacterium]MDD5665313.1 UDP-N-acetylmuramoyl-L-alanyl-D-glutamate--2,6-diaminopimelate ligase [Candidatus Omnitrophota bacterium]
MKIEEIVKLIKSGKAKGISCNSKAVRKGFIFIAVKGVSQDGSRFIDEAIRRGAIAVVCDSQVKRSGRKGLYLIKVKDTRLAAASLAAEFYGNPSRRLKVIGITGTCGKTTVAYILEAIIHKAGFKPAVIGTVNYRFNKRVVPSKNTTPGPVELQSLMSNMVKENINYSATEVSSHALDQGRVRGIDFHSAVFTNLTQDHLDYHKSLNSYFHAKSKLFKGLSGKAFAVLNMDDKRYSLLKKITKAGVITYGLGERAQVRAEKISYGLKSTKFILVFPGGRLKIAVRLIGRHNIYNLLAAFAWGFKEGLPLDKIKNAVENFNFAPGRLEPVRCGMGFYIFVDYAHTEDALRNTLESLRKLSLQRIITVFGCGGERDTLKRPKMGKVASELSDFVIITNDNPRFENPEDIIKDIAAGIKKDNYSIICDRRKAIRSALVMAKKGDIVLVAGKGHEKYQILKNKVIRFDDCKEISRCLKSMN